MRWADELIQIALMLVSLNRLIEGMGK